MVDPGISARNGIRDRVTQRADTQHAAALSHDCMAFGPGASVEDFGGRRPVAVEPFNGLAFVVGTRIAAGSEYDADGGPWIPDRRHLIQTTVHRRETQCPQIALESVHDRLGFRVTESAVVLDLSLIHI